MVQSCNPPIWQTEEEEESEGGRRRQFLSKRRQLAEFAARQKRGKEAQESRRRHLKVQHLSLCHFPWNARKTWEVLHFLDLSSGHLAKFAAC